MAKLFKCKKESKANDYTFVCYSERGLISFLMFRYLYKEKYLKNFLRKIRINEREKPFDGLLKGHKIVNIKIFSECDFGEFGNPDGIIYFELDGDKYVVFFEAKINESVQKSNSGKIYASTIKGQLELKWRLVNEYFNEKDKVGSARVQKIVSKNTDNYYSFDGQEERSLKLEYGVKDIFDTFFSDVQQDKFYFIAVTKENNSSYPLIGDNRVKVEDESKNNKIGWINISDYSKSVKEMPESLKNLIINLAKSEDE